MRDARVLARRGCALIAAAALIGGLVACGGSTPVVAPVASTLKPADVLLAPGQTARFALVPDSDSATRQSDAPAWRTDDGRVATVAGQADGSALVSAAGEGVTKLTATRGAATWTATVRVGLQALSSATLNSLAGFATQAAADGLITRESPVLPRQLSASAELLAALRADLGDPPRTATIRVNPTVFDANPVIITSADLTLDGSAAAGRAMTHDGTLELGILLFLRRLEDAGCPMQLFYDAMRAVNLHQAGSSSGGVEPRTGVPAVTLFPGLRYYNGSLILIGTPMIVFDNFTADAIRNNELIEDGSLTEAGSTVLHELMHVSLEQRDLDDLDDDLDATVGLLEALMRAKADLMLSAQLGAVSATAVRAYNAAYQTIIAGANGPAVLDAFGQLQDPAAPNLTAPQEVSVGQAFTVTLALAGATPKPDADVLVQISGAVVNPGSRVVRTNAQGVATLTLQAGPEQGAVVIEAEYLTDARRTEVAVVDPQQPGAYVVLDYTLASADGFQVYPAGSVIFLDRTEQGRVAGPEAGGCDSDHLHSDGGLFIDEFGPFEDLAQDQCGYGHVFHAPPPE